MDSIDFNHMLNPIFINIFQNVFGFNWFEFFFFFFGWNSVALISFERDEMFTYCWKTFHDRNAFGQIEARFGCLNDWVCMLDLIKQLLVFCWCMVFDSCMAHPVDSKAANQFSSLLEACQRSRAIFWLCKTLLGCRLTIDTTRDFWKISKSCLHGQLWTSVTFYVHLLWCSLTSILNEALQKILY